MGIVCRMIEIVEYRPAWPQEFSKIGAEIRNALGNQAIAIHHIGSTSVPGLVAKDVIDVQITVATLGDEAAGKMEAAGYECLPFRTDHCPPGMTLAEEELQKMMFRRDGRRTNIHMRAEGRFNHEYPLLCRDYLRTHAGAADSYGKIKQELARYFPEDVEAYYDIKDPVFDVLMAGARDWAEWTGWEVPPTDA